MLRYEVFVKFVALEMLWCSGHFVELNFCCNFWISCFPFLWNWNVTSKLVKFDEDFIPNIEVWILLRFLSLFRFCLECFMASWCGISWKLVVKLLDLIPGRRLNSVNNLFSHLVRCRWDLKCLWHLTAIKLMLRLVISYVLIFAAKYFEFFLDFCGI